MIHGSGAMLHSSVNPCIDQQDGWKCLFPSVFHLESLCTQQSVKSASLPSERSPACPPKSPCSREQELEQMLLWIKRSCERKFGQAAPFCRPDPAAAPGCELSVCIAGDELQNHQ